MTNIELHVPCMNGGSGETSYAKNSILQKTAISKAWPFLEETIKDMFINVNMRSSFSNGRCLKIADLGCSSGPNTLFVISEIIDTVHKMYLEANEKSPIEFQVFLNDLPTNDFNTIFKSLPNFYKEKNFGSAACFISAMPGSFFERLFPNRSINFVHSCYSLHWLSKVPEKVENKNKRNIYIAKSSPWSVCEAYSEQFRKDFSAFLMSRSQEIISGGTMFHTFLGRSIADPSSNDCSYLWELLAKSLLQLVDEGVVEEGGVDSFNMPLYFPCEEEVKSIVKEEGSFNLDKFETFEVNWDPNDDDININISNNNFDDDDDDDDVFKNKERERRRRGENVANSIRAVTEPLLVSHFGNAVIDPLFARYAKLVAEHLAVENTKHFSLVVSMTKK